MNDWDDITIAELRAEDYAERVRQNRRKGCACFAPGEASGTCPGQDACPMCAEDEDEQEEA